MNIRWEHLPRACREQIYGIFRSGFLYYEEWRTEKFKEVKDEIKQEYHLGSKEFSEAVNLIKKNRFFSENIGCEKIFGTITQEELKEYASLVKYYSRKEQI